MRSILTISVPEKERKNIETRAKKAGYSVSCYMLYASRLEQNMISEDELVKMVKKAEKDHRAGKTKRLRSLEDL